MFTKVKKAKIENCLVDDNVTLERGGGLFFYYANYVQLFNCTFKGNVARVTGGAIGVGYNPYLEI